MKPCEICLEKECKAKGGRGSCDCENCSQNHCCPKLSLQPTIRITLKCTQSCSHCCFSCNPKEDTHMSLETAKVIASFLKAHEIFTINLMGGEIFCHPKWKEILDILLPAVEITRIVSNGDWASDLPEFAEYVAKHKNCYVALSKDQWHTNKNVDKAEQLLIKNDITYKISKLEEKESDLVPIGNAQFTYGIYSSFGTYCSNPEHRYSFLIDEEGKIYKCSFGVWDYADVHEYVDGGFAERFREFNMIFYNTFISNCRACYNGYKTACK